MAEDENGVQGSASIASEGSASTRFLHNSDLQVVTDEARSEGFRQHLLPSLTGRFDSCSFGERVGNFLKDSIPLRHRGHGIEPAASDISFALIVEQRFSAHLTQSSCPQPKT